MKQQNEMTIIKSLVLLIFIIAILYTAHDASAETPMPDLWVFGDSFESRRDAWPVIIAEHKLYHVKNAAQGGLQMAQFKVPEYLRCIGGEHSPDVRVVLSLGINDYLSGIPIAESRAALVAALDALQAKQCPVYLSLPPVDIGAYEIRSVWTETSANYSNITLLDPPYSVNATIDGIHPNYRLQRWIAYYYALSIKQG